MPPDSLTVLKKAVSSLPITPYAEAGPLYGMVLPILSSVAVTPGDAAALEPRGAIPPKPAASPAAAVPVTRVRRVKRPVSSAIPFVSLFHRSAPPAHGRLGAVRVDNPTV